MDATADRRLGQVQHRRGPREATAPRDRDERLQLVELHSHQYC
jgi:hypothetical protein